MKLQKKTVYEMPKSIVSGEPIWANNNNQLIHQTSPYYNKDIFVTKQDIQLNQGIHLLVQLKGVIEN